MDYRKHAHDYAYMNRIKKRIRIPEDAFEENIRHHDYQSVLTDRFSIIDNLVPEFQNKTKGKQKWM